MVQARIFRLPVVKERVRSSRSSIHEFIGSGMYPKPVLADSRGQWDETFTATTQFKTEQGYDCNRLREQESADRCPQD